MRYLALTLLAMVVAGCGDPVTPSGTPSSAGAPSAGLFDDVEQALRACGWLADTPIGWSGHGTLSDLGLPMTAGDVEGLIVVSAEPMTDPPFDYPAADPPLRWFCAIPDDRASVGSDSVFGPVPEDWQAPGSS